MNYTISAQLTRAISELIRFTANASPENRECLATCQLCRNFVLYVLDTVPATGNTDFIATRISGLQTEHRYHTEHHSANQLAVIRDRRESG